MLGALSQLRSWKLDHRHDDIRGWPLRDPEGHLLGKVGELIVDTDTRHVTQVILDDGKRYAAHDVVLGEDTLLFAGAAPERVASPPPPMPPPAKERILASPPPPTPPPKPQAPRERIAADAKSDLADLVIPIIEETISVGKRTVAAGGLQAESHILAKDFEQEVRLRDERVKVERRQVNEPLSLAEAEARLREGSVEVRAISEQAIIDKRVRVVEEIVLRKESKEHVEHVRDTLRHTEVELTDLPPAGDLRPAALREKVEPREEKALGPEKRANGGVVIPVIAEELTVAKREVEAGGIRIATRIASTPIDKTVTIREEHVTLERRVVDRSVQATDEDFRDRAYEVTARSEEPVITKQARVVEEIRVHKDAGERIEKIHEKLRHTDVKVREVAGERRFSAARYLDHFKQNPEAQRYGFDSYAPAYEFGERLRYRNPGSAWSDIEGTARTLWEGKNPGTWARYCDAIQHAWDRCTS